MRPGGAPRRPALRQHYAPDGAPLDLEAEGADAVLWQHELDHLDGVLYPDRILWDLLPIEEMRRRREEKERREGPIGSAPRSRRLAAF